GSFAVKDSVATVAAFGPLLPRVSAGLCFEDMLARLIDKLAAWAAEGQLPGPYLGLRAPLVTVKRGASVELVSGVGTDLKNTPKGARLRWHKQAGIGIGVEAATFGELAHVGREMTGEEVLSGRFASFGMV